MAASSIGQWIAIFIGEFHHHWRRRSQLTVHLFYALLLAYILQLLIHQPTPRQYITLYWLAVLFTNLQLGSQAYLYETRRHLLFYYWIVPPVLMFWIRAVFSSIMQAVVMVVLVVLLAFFWGPLPMRWTEWVALISTTALGFGFSFALISAIARFTRRPFIIMSILGIPIIIPLLYSAIHLHTTLISGATSIRLWLTLPALWGIVAGIGSILIPHLQRH